MTDSEILGMAADVLTELEGFSSAPYPDPGDGVLRIGYGSRANGKTSVTKDEARSLLIEQLTERWKVVNSGRAIALLNGGSMQQKVFLCVCSYNMTNEEMSTLMSSGTSQLLAKNYIYIRATQISRRRDLEQGLRKRSRQEFALLDESLVKRKLKEHFGKLEVYKEPEEIGAVAPMIRAFSGEANAMVEDVKLTARLVNKERQQVATAFFDLYKSILRGIE